MDETCGCSGRFPDPESADVPVSGTGMAGMECVAVNLVEPMRVVVCVNGVFGNE
jgi:aspartate aminotransferase-like enzyme